MKVALYLRVSTARQAEKDLSIPDQRTRLEAWCRDKGWIVAAEFVEPGASATDDKRAQFQRMMDDATRKDRPFDAVLVHSFSRFFRDAFHFELRRRALGRNNVARFSITQAVAEDSTFPKAWAVRVVPRRLPLTFDGVPAARGRYVTSYSWSRQPATVR